MTDLTLNFVPFCAARFTVTTLETLLKKLKSPNDFGNGVLLQICIYVFKIKKFKRETRDKNTIWLKSDYSCIFSFESQPETGHPASCYSDSPTASD